MKLLALCAAGIGLMLCASCTNNKHLISDEAERAAVQQDFEARRDTLAQGDLFQVFEQPMSDEQKEAMTFLYAYMPLADIADHPGEFYLETWITLSRRVRRCRGEKWFPNASSATLYCPSA